jgi:hypothetical protein
MDYLCVPHYVDTDASPFESSMKHQIVSVQVLVSSHDRDRKARSVPNNPSLVRPMVFFWKLKSLLVAILPNPALNRGHVGEMSSTI